MQHKRLFTGILFVSMLLLVALGISQAQDDGQPVFRIGVLGDARGSLAQGAQLAVQEINAEGGVQGADGTRFRLELVIEGTEIGDNLDSAIAAIEQARVIAVIGPETTDDVIANLPLLQNLGVPVLTPALGDTVIASDSTGFLFRIRAAERLLGNALADYLVNDLNINQITTVQLDRASTASRVGFSFALGQLQNSPEEITLLFESDDELSALVADVMQRNPAVLVMYGGPDLARDFYIQLREAGWSGTIAYDQATHPAFRETVPLRQLAGIISTTTWPISATDTDSIRFITKFVETIGEAPDAISASTYDAIYLMAAAINEPGDLQSNLSNLREIEGVQGMLNPPSLDGARGEISESIAVVEMNSLGGTDLAARYAGPIQLELTDPEVIVDVGTEQPTPTPTPDGVVITIDSAVQNVRTGPSTDYEVLGQVRQGEQFPVIGATRDFSWVVIQYRGQQGWLATYLLDVFGDRSTVPIIANPPTPTPGPATATPTPPAIPDLIILSASPANITRGVPTQVRVIVRNQGGSSAGPFAVAATFAPSEFFTAVNLDGLAAGTEREISLPVNITGATGNYTVAIVADLNSEVNEGQNGEANNIYNYNYRLDQASSGANVITLGSGSSVDLDPALAVSNDIQYTGAGLQTVGSCDGSRNCIGLISPTLNWDTAHYDAITSANGVNAGFISNAALQPGTTLGVLTADGLRGVIRIDAISPGVSVTFTYRIYQ